VCSIAISKMDVSKYDLPKFAKPNFDQVIHVPDDQDCVFVPIDFTSIFIEHDGLIRFSNFAMCF